MAKEYPYFKWFPKDAEADEKYSAMDDAELGFFHRCLNKSWMNEGLPADPAERARVLKTPIELANERWKRIGRSFIDSEMFPGKVVNPRQEIERVSALTKTVNGRNAANKRHHLLDKTPAPPPLHPPPAQSPNRNTSVAEFRELCDAFDRHDKHSNWEGKDSVLQIISGMNGQFDWDKFRANHSDYCLYWDEKGWQYCTVTFLGWVRAGMPQAPKISAGRNASSAPTACDKCGGIPCFCDDRITSGADRSKPSWTEKLTRKKDPDTES